MLMIKFKELLSHLLILKKNKKKKKLGSQNQPKSIAFNDSF